MGPSGEIWKWIQREIVSEEAGNLNKAAMIQDTYITAGRKRVSIETGPIIPLVKPRWADNHNVFIDDRIRHLDDIWPSLHYFWSSMFPRPFSSSALDVSCTPVVLLLVCLGNVRHQRGLTLDRSPHFILQWVCVISPHRGTSDRQTRFPSVRLAGCWAESCVETKERADQRESWDWSIFRQDWIVTSSEKL